MCGIIGYVGKKEAADVLIDGLKRLEYRGYDSAGIAVLNGHGIEVERAEGKLSHLEELLRRTKPHGHIGIGHTRWATHGAPSQRNAHPHRVGDVVVVHNGIIENYSELRKALIKKGAHFLSETDTEIFAHLIDQELKRTKDNNVEHAIRKSLAKVRGSYALVVLCEKTPEKLYVAKLASPLVVGFGKNENLVASDVPALLPYTRDVIYLEDGELACITAKTIQIHNQAGKTVTRKKQKVDWNPVMAEKGGFKHFMLKEIFEQPRVVEETLMGRLQLDSGKIHLEGLPQLFSKGAKIENVMIVACGTSWHAGMVAKYWLESFARIPTNVMLASEFRYCDPLVNQHTLLIPISQSGETADTIAAIQLAKKQKSKVLGVCNVLGSTISRMSVGGTLYTHAGPEICVASTKAFVSQLTVLYMIALDLAWRRHKMGKEELVEKMTELRKIPQLMDQILKQADNIKALAEKLAERSHFLFIGRGPNYPLALEGALKLKEISYAHAEGFAAGELKHGPIAMIDKGVPVIALIPQSTTYEKVMSNVEECQSRGADVVAIGEATDRSLREKFKMFIPIPKTKFSLTPLLYAIPLQLFAYYVADHKGTDVDQPRNLAKSVTVE
ncbi:MAG: glutamine--fructose-6-phosphate transaminase (isomerizing) [Deltaproteobacteria bacterium]|nr:glutamine--fructose-6-phosphate transaminase (isomerizing) [Deltaproteobacteria bacterium]